MSCNSEKVLQKWEISSTFSALNQTISKSRFTSQLDKFPEKKVSEKYNPFERLPSNII